MICSSSLLSFGSGMAMNYSCCLMYYYCSPYARQFFRSGGFRLRASGNRFGSL